MGFGSYLRFGLGILLSLEVIRLWLAGSSLSTISIALAIILLILSAMWFVFKF